MTRAGGTFKQREKLEILACESTLGPQLTGKCLAIFGAKVLPSGHVRRKQVEERQRRQVHPTLTLKAVVHHLVECRNVGLATILHGAHQRVEVLHDSRR